MGSITLTDGNLERFKTLIDFTFCKKRGITQVKDLGIEFFFEEIGSLLGNTGRTLANKYSDARIVIKKKHIKDVCAYILEYFNEDNKKESYKAEYETSIQFINRIYELADLQNPFSKSSLSETEQLGSKSYLHYKMMDDYHYPDREDKTIIEIANLVNKFYSALEELEYKEAWSLLSQDFRQRKFRNYYEEFKGYYAAVFKNFSHAEIYEIIQLDEFVFECQVGYMFTQKYPSSELDLLTELTINDIKQFTRVLKLFRQRLEKAKGHKIDEIRLSSFFQKQALLNIWQYYVPKNQSVLKEFPNTIQRSVCKLDLCTCKLYQGSWAINNIRGIITNANEDVYVPDHYS
jgi:hypothetical protein